MGVFTAIAVAVKAIVAKITFAAVAKFVATILVSSLVSRVMAKRLGQGAGGGEGGGRIQLPPATENKIPVVYGSAFLGGPITDAYLTPDQKTMYYVVALAEKTDNGTISFGNIYYDGKLVTFGSDGLGGTTKVTSLTTNSTPAQIDTKINGYLNIYLYNNGSTSGTNTSQNAYDVMPSWGTSAFAMTNCAFAIIKVTYNTDAGTTSLGAVTAQVINTESGQTTGVYRPGTAIYDYLTNTRYGCAIPSSQVDGNATTGSLGAVNTYSDETITYTPVGGGSATQARYRVNGPLDTAQNCLTNLQLLVDTCDSWLQYSELNGKWRVVLNKAYTGSISNLYLVDSSNLVGGIQINPIDLNETYNEVEVAYPNKNIKDQTDYQVIELSDYVPEVMSPNEAINRLNVSLPLVNEVVQAKYLAVRRLLQSREDITISFQTDFSGIQVEAGDVIRVKHDAYGWDVLNSGNGKLFRVLSVAEQTFEDNTVGTQIVAFEYNGDIYDDNAIQDFIPSFNTGLVDPNVFDIPITPTAANGTNANSGTTYFTLTGTTPANGVTTYFDFNYGNSTNVAQHILYRTAQNGIGEAFPANANVTISINDLVQGNYYFSVTARNDFGGRQSASTANAFYWAGPEVTTYDANSNTGGIGGNNIRPNSISANMFITGIEPIEVVNVLSGCNVNTIGKTVFYTVDNKLYTCNGSSYNATIQAPVYANEIANVYANTVFGNFTTANLPTANLIGQIVAGQIGNAAVTANTIAANAVIANNIAANAVLAGCIAADAVVANNIAANAVIAGKIATDAVTSNTIAANAVTADKIVAGAVTAGKISVSQLDAISAAMGTLTSGTIRTSSANNVPRVEISSSGNFPLWYGNNTKTAANALFYLDTGGNAFFGGTLSAAGGTINFDTTAVSNNGLFGFLKGAQFVLCRDGDNVVYPIEYPPGTASRVSVIFVGGGITYSNDPNLAPPLYQNFQALNVTETGFDASLKLQEAVGSGTLSTQNDSFSGGTSVSKSLANVAYDNIYTADFSANIYCDYYIDLSEFGGSSLYYGYIDVSLVANTGSGNVTISPTPTSAYAFRSAGLGPGYEVVTGYSIYGTVTGAGANSMFYLDVANTGYGNGTVSGGNLTYTYSSATANNISATPTGVPAVVALVYLQ
jgi:hypothetical protein